jgi:aminoglycoside phosphotransferase
MEAKQTRWSNSDRCYIINQSTFTKRELLPHERQRNLKGEIITTPWSRERLENERAALEYIREHTTIPVPRVIDFRYHEWGCCLTTTRVDGVELDEVTGEARLRALENAEIFVQEVVLPQLRRLTSASIGSLTGIVIPPTRVSTKDKRRYWPAKISHTAQYVFCHNDLTQHNILVDPITLRVSAIIDWEFAGFFPPEFEAPLWLHSWKARPVDDEDTDRLIDFLTESGKLSSNLSVVY